MKIENSNQNIEDIASKPVGSRIEKYSATLLMFIGIVYLGVWIISIFSETGAFMTVSEDKVAVSKSELFSHVRTLVTIVLSLIAGVALFRKQPIGFITGVAILVLFFLICSGGLYQALKLREVGLIAFATAGWLILFTGIVILLLPATRKRLRVGGRILIITLVMTVLLSLFYFFVQ